MKRLFACLLVLALLSALPLAAMAKPLPAVSIIGPGSFTYSGLPNCPVLQMIDGSYTLIEGVDYTVEYYLNVDVPGGTWTVYPLGIYTNARSDQLIINKAPLPTINAIPDQVYTGSAITPALSLNPALPLHNFNIVYSNNTAAGQAKVTLTSKGTNVEGGSVSGNFNIQYLSLPLPLPPIASLAYTTISYDGSAKTPAVTITGLVLDRDFTVSYQKNTAVGTAQASATGMGNYTGVSTASFEITHTHVWGAWKDNDDRKTHSRNCSALPTHSQTADCTFKEELFPPTCTEGGYTQFTCTVCGFGYWDFFTDPTGHTWGDCLSNNDATHTCTCKTDPSHKWTEGCTFSATVVVPTCEQGGYTEHVCDLCGYTYQDAVTKPTGHDWGTWTANQDGSHSRACKTDPLHTEKADCVYTDTVTPPTCTDDGLTTHVCQVCGYTYTDAPTKALGHDWGAWTTNKDGSHSRACKTDAKHTERADCVYTDTITSPTCTGNGFTTHVCQVCSDTYTDTPIKALGHDWGAWTANKDGTHSRVCKRDAGHAETAACAYTAVVTAPTCTEGGYSDFTCAACGHSYRGAFTAALGHQPGDWQTVKRPTDLRRGEEVLACQLCGTPLDSQTLPRLTHIEGRTATLEGDEFPDMMGRDFRIRYMSLPLDLEKDSVWEARVIASNRYVIGTLTITLKEGQLLLSFQPADPTVVIRQAYLTLFAGDPAEFVQQDLDLVEEQPLPLDEWFPLKALDGAAGQSHLFLRFDVNFDTTGLAIVTLP